jgi:hypothetical protein
MEGRKRGLCQKKRETGRKIENGALSTSVRPSRSLTISIETERFCKYSLTTQF